MLKEKVSRYTRFLRPFFFLSLRAAFIVRFFGRCRSTFFSVTPGVARRLNTDTGTLIQTKHRYTRSFRSLIALFVTKWSRLVQPWPMMDALALARPSLLISSLNPQSWIPQSWVPDYTFLSPLSSSLPNKDLSRRRSEGSPDIAKIRSGSSARTLLSRFLSWSAPFGKGQDYRIRGEGGGEGYERDKKGRRAGDAVNGNVATALKSWSVAAVLSR